MTARPGVYGLDLLAYRHRTVDPVALTRTVVKAAAGPVKQRRLALRVHDGAELLGLREVVAVERVLRTVPAADHASTAARAPSEVDRDRGGLERVHHAQPPRDLA